ncbi:MAG: hypothetical protein EOP53_24855 [Sphingobacteriales bacterium]|nr:MAG: hypothetical protein EOP53_24855 [Sphingobacteriales bacterium]
MKKIIIACLLLSLFSCKKEVVIENFKEELAGSWELERRSDYTGTQQYPAGNGDILVFDKVGNYQRKSIGSITQSSTYKLSRKKDCHQSDSDIMIKLGETSSDTRVYVQIKNNQLIFNTSNCYADGATTTYRRLP